MTPRSIWAVLDYLPRPDCYPSGFSPRAYHLLNAVGQRWPLSILALNRDDPSWNESSFLPEDFVECSLSYQSLGANPLYVAGTRGKLRRASHHLFGKRSGMSYPEHLPNFRELMAKERPLMVLFFLPHNAHFAFDLPASVSSVYVLEEGLERSASLVAPAMPRWKSQWLDRTEQAGARRLYGQLKERGGRVVAISEEEKHWFGHFFPESMISVVPYGIDCDFYQPLVQEQDIDVSLFGALSHIRNYEPMAELFSHLKSRHPAEHEKIAWAFVGSRPHESLRSLESPFVLVSGFVPDVRPFYARSKVVVVPSQQGGGVKSTILQAWAMGKAVVATSFAVTGLPAQPGENVLLGDTPEELAQHILALLHSPELRQNLEKAARKTVLQERNAKLIALQFAEMCAEIIQEKGGAQE